MCPLDKLQQTCQASRYLYSITTMKGFFLLASLCAVIVIANGNPFLASLENNVEQESEQVNYILTLTTIITILSLLQMQGSHTTEEILAAAICQSEVPSGNTVYAVGRKCVWPTHTSTCDQICSSPTLRNQDNQVKDKKMSCVGALHVYGSRPITNKMGEETTATLGLKTRREGCSYSSCGANYCCCAAYRA